MNKTFENSMMVFFLIGALIAMQIMGYNLLGALNAPDSADLTFHLQAAGIAAVLTVLALIAARMAEVRSNAL